jgi:hypothetical protein
MEGAFSQELVEFDDGWFHPNRKAVTTLSLLECYKHISL